MTEITRKKDQFIPSRKLRNQFVIGPKFIMPCVSTYMSKAHFFFFLLKSLANLLLSCADDSLLGIGYQITIIVWICLFIHCNEPKCIQQESNLGALPI